MAQRIYIVEEESFRALINGFLAAPDKAAWRGHAETMDGHVPITVRVCPEDLGVHSAPRFVGVTKLGTSFSITMVQT